MARPSKAKELRHSHRIMLRFTDIEYEILCTDATNANLPLAEYARKQLMNKKIIAKYEIVADVLELKKLTGELGKIGNNLNQIARYFNQGGSTSLEIRKAIFQCIASIYDIKAEVIKMAGDFQNCSQTLDV